jgi:uncharacterized membrane protein YbhN (UPF0104 family)
MLWLVLVALVDHGLRYWRWDTLLRQVGSRDFERKTAFLLFSASSPLIFTPNRVGEVVKSVYAWNYFRIPVVASLPVLAAERLVDITLMAILAGVGLLLIGEAPYLWLSGVILAGVLLMLPMAVTPPERRLRVCLGLPCLSSKVRQWLNIAAESRRLLLVPRMLAANIAFGASAWVAEVFIYFLALLAVGAHAEPHLFIVALAAFPLASLGGSLSFLPGGLGVTEGGLVALGMAFASLNAEPALVAALMARVAILGVVVVVGLVSLLILHLGLVRKPIVKDSA